jgi:H+-translocating NAD(P) transhydrogenase subunit alpha
MAIVISVPKETRNGEQRVALVPDAVKKLASDAITVQIHEGAGESAGYSNEDYEAASAIIVPNEKSLYRDADIVLTMNPPQEPTIQLLREQSLLLGFLNPYSDVDRFKVLQSRQISALSMELVPRISRAQGMDALSSQASIAGYKAVLMASTLSGKFFPMLTTAAGTV